MDPAKVARFIYDTGMHGIVLAHSGRWRLHIVEDGRIAWWRPKKKMSDSGAFIILPPSPRIAPWYREFVETLPSPTCTTVYHPSYRKVNGARVISGEYETCSCHRVINEMVGWVGDEIGLPGLSPRTLRHTLGCRVYETTRDINEVMETLGCSMAVALRYAKYVDPSKVAGPLSSGAL